MTCGTAGIRSGPAISAYRGNVVPLMRPGPYRSIRVVRMTHRSLVHPYQSGMSGLPAPMAPSVSTDGCRPASADAHDAFIVGRNDTRLAGYRSLGLRETPMPCAVSVIPVVSVILAATAGFWQRRRYRCRKPYRRVRRTRHGRHHRCCRRHRRHRRCRAWRRRPIPSGRGR